MGEEEGIMMKNLSRRVRAALSAHPQVRATAQMAVVAAEIGALVALSHGVTSGHAILTVPAVSVALLLGVQLLRLWASIDATGGLSADGIHWALGGLLAPGMPAEPEALVVEHERGGVPAKV